MNSPLSVSIVFICNIYWHYWCTSHPAPLTHPSSHPTGQGLVTLVDTPTLYTPTSFHYAKTTRQHFAKPRFYIPWILALVWYIWGLYFSTFPPLLGYPIHSFCTGTWVLYFSFIQCHSLTATFIRWKEGVACCVYGTVGQANCSHMSAGVWLISKKPPKKRLCIPALLEGAASV